MYVSRVRIDGVLGFHGDRAVDLTLTRPDGSHAGWTVIAGRNGSGKTTLLRAVAIALCTPAQAYPLAPDLQSWRSAEPGRIELTVGLDDEDDRLLGYLDPDGRVDAVETVCTWSAPDGRPRSRSQVVWSRRTVGSLKPVPDGDWEVFSEDQFAGYGPFRRLAREAPAETSDLATLFDDEAPLSEGIAWLVAEHHRSLEGRDGASAAVSDVLAFLGDGLLPDGFRVSRVDSDGLWVEQGGQEFPLRELSGGHRTAVALVLNLLWALAVPFANADLPLLGASGTVMPYPAVVLIDEIDAHLHVTWQQRIGGWLKTHFPAVQFVVTTHSPYICQSADPGGLIRLGSAGDRTAPEVVSVDLYQRVVYGTGDDAIMSELFGLDTPFSPEAERLRLRAGDLEGAMMDGVATDAERAEYEELSAKLTSSLSTRAAEVAALLGRRE
ncbi:AAA family ATPase [Streptacidiphilus cavernicola]|uniref:AAA family ATPase n=1 Tax=Streptacidiphilus cavernicola TaxID=3342716 RepID=A0ABV6VUQ5_9ACTN